MWFAGTDGSLTLEVPLSSDSGSSQQTYSIPQLRINLLDQIIKVDLIILFKG